MFRPAVKRAVAQNASRSASKSAASRRFLSTAPPHQKSRGWKNSALRWGLAGTLVYYYNTTNVFAEEPALARYPIPENTNSEVLSTLDEVAAQRQAKARAQVEAEAKKQGTTATIPPIASVEDENEGSVVDAKVEGVDEAAPGGPQELEEEAGQQGAFNEETGEINWECPCLGGMAHGPCGEQFRDAFSCFVYSKEEPKGMDCIEKFKTMQNCFREHPDIYGSELDDDVEDEARQNEGADMSESSSSDMPQIPEANPNAEKLAHTEPDHPENVQAKRERSVAATEQVKNDHGILSEADEVVPKAWHDSTGESKGKK